MKWREEWSLHFVTKLIQIVILHYIVTKVISEDAFFSEMSLSLHIGFLPKIFATMAMRKDLFTNIKLEQQTQKVYIIQFNNQLAK